MIPDMDFLCVNKNAIVNSAGNRIQLRGFGVGGWMNLENFINGYPGSESQLRRICVQELGTTRTHVLFDRMMDYFLSEPDIKFMKQCGANVVRLSLNYRHFESDEQPFTYLEQGFHGVNKAVDWCANNNVYVILDLHSVQGWQNPDWHCDNPNRISLIWEHALFQDRFIALWQEFARRFKGNPTIAGYNIMNEPVTGDLMGPSPFLYNPDWDSLNGLYRTTVDAIREIDPDHIIFLG